MPCSGSFGSWEPLPHSLAQLVWALPSLEKQGLSTAASQKSEYYRFAGGLSLLSHRSPRTLLSLGSTHPRALYQDSIREAQAAAGHSCQAGGTEGDKSSPSCACS